MIAHTLRPIRKARLDNLSGLFFLQMKGKLIGCTSARNFSQYVLDDKLGKSYHD